MFSYVAYGLGIQSALALPEFVAADTRHEVVIRLGNHHAVPSEAIGKPWYIRWDRKDATLFFQDVGIFRVRAGREVVVSPAPGVLPSRVRLYLVGTIMAVLLCQRGFLVLHASAVEIDGEAIAFVGASGAGKSSMAAALHARGHRVVADDVGPVDLAARPARLFSAFPQLKLYPSIATALGYPRQSLQSIDPWEAKMGCHVPRQFTQRALPLRRIYLLAPGDVPRAERLRPQEALLELLGHSYPSKLLQSGGAPHFRQCVQLANEVPIYRLVRPHDPSALPDLARRVEEHGVVLSGQEEMALLG